MRHVIIFIIFLTIFFTGCGSVGVVRMTNVKNTQNPSGCYLEIYGSENDINRQFEVVCIISSETGGTIFERRDIDAAIDKLRPEACRCGADGILIIDARKEGPMSSFSSGWGRGKVSVKAIRFIDSKID